MVNRKWVTLHIYLKFNLILIFSMWVLSVSDLVYLLLNMEILPLVFNDPGSKLYCTFAWNSISLLSSVCEYYYNFSGRPSHPNISYITREWVTCTFSWKPTSSPLPCENRMWANISVKRILLNNIFFYGKQVSCITLFSKKLYQMLSLWPIESEWQSHCSKIHPH